MPDLASASAGSSAGRTSVALGAAGALRATKPGRSLDGVHRKEPLTECSPPLNEPLDDASGEADDSSPAAQDL